MSFIGGKYRYDVFVSYSHAVALDDPTGYDSAKRLRDWSRKVVREIDGLLRVGFADDGGFSLYLDDREAESGMDLSAEVEEAVRASALLLVLMSPSYRDSTWCRNELQWFFDEAGKDGRDLEHCVIRVIAPTSNRPAKPWPAELLGRDGQVVHYGEPLHDNTLPIEIELAGSDEPFTALAQPIRGMVNEILRKLRRFKTQLDLKATTAPPSDTITPTPPAAPAHSDPSPDVCTDDMLPQLYLQRHNDAPAWAWVKEALANVALVTPMEMEPAPDLSLVRTYAARRRDALTSCQGLVLMRWTSEEPNQVQVGSGYDDRRTLKTYDVDIPWVLVDNIGGEVPDVLAQYKLPRVVVDAGGEWQGKVLHALGLK